MFRGELLNFGRVVTPIYKPFVEAIWKGSHNPILRGQQLIMIMNHLLNGMILQVGDGHQPNIRVL